MSRHTAQAGEIVEVQVAVSQFREVTSAQFTLTWDPAVLQRFRADPIVGSIGGGIDHKASADQIEHIATLLPEEWLNPAATGSAQQCVQRIRAEFDYGADAVILHGATPRELEPIVAQYRQSVPETSSGS